jgi:outer membrane protein TolC
LQPAFAEETVALNDLIKEAAENSPRIKAAKLEWARVIQRYPQAVALEDPMFEYWHPIERMETKYELWLTQKFPFPGRLGLEGDIAAKEVEMAKAMYDKEVRDVIAAVKKSFYELYYIDNAISLTGQNKKVLEHFTEIVTTDYAKDATSLNDVLKAQSQYAQVSYDLILLREMRSTEVTRLNTLLNRNPEHEVAVLEKPVVEPFEHSIDELYKWAADNEEMRIADAKVKKDDLGTSLSRYKYLPEFELGVVYKDRIETLKDDTMIIFGMNIPFWFSKNRAAAEEYRINREKSIEERKALKNEIQNQVKNIYFKITNSDRLVKLYASSLIPQAQKSMEIAETWYKEGEGSFSGLLETQSIWLNFQLAYYRAVSDYLKYIADMEMVTGRKL